MQPKNLSELNDQELLKKRTQLKTSKTIDAGIVGFTIGIVAYSAIVNGFGFFTFFPLIITYAVVKNSANNKILASEVQKEIEARGLA
jgi:hypothetical protein